MTWDNDLNAYYAKLTPEKTIYVDSDGFADSLSDEKKRLLQEKYPGIEEDDITEKQYESAYFEAQETLIDSDMWEDCAIGLKPGEEIPITGPKFSAWIEYSTLQAYYIDYLTEDQYTDLSRERTQC